MLEGFGPSKKTLKPDAVPSVFSFVPPPKSEGMTSEARIAQTTHHGIIDELLSPAAGPRSQQDDAESEPLTKDVGIQCG